MINLIINGEKKSFDVFPLLSGSESPTLQNWLTHYPSLPSTYAIALNAEFIPRHRYTCCLLKDGDHIEIVTPFPGG
jgi:thiamine biosynthesis protein ThiS